LKTSVPPERERLYELELAEGVELGAEGVDAGAAAGVEDEESLVAAAAGLSEGLDESVFFDSDFESEEDSLDLEDESPDESLELELLGA
jgi:hypothetical protein